MRHLILNLEAPLMAFGGETIDNLGVIRWFPSASMLTGIAGQCPGLAPNRGRSHQRLQDRLVFAARIDREPRGRLRLRDFQTAQLNKNDRGWTTRGQPEGRAGGANTYDAPHLRYRDYFADMRVTVALRLQPETNLPLSANLNRRSKIRPGLFSSGASRASLRPICSPASSKLTPLLAHSWHCPWRPVGPLQNPSGCSGLMARMWTASTHPERTCSPTSATGCPASMAADASCARESSL